MPRPQPKKAIFDRATLRLVAPNSSSQSSAARADRPASSQSAISTAQGSITEESPKLVMNSHMDKHTPGEDEAF